MVEQRNPVAGLFPRMIAGRLRAALSDTPVVLIHGARQVGKTTLAIASGGEGRATVSLDQASVRSAAAADPDGFVGGLPESVFLDEVQRVPDLIPAIKHVVDQDRTPGRFLLTGSANVLSIPRIAESLTGRIEICSLAPLSQTEIRRSGGNAVDRFFAASAPEVHPGGAGTSPDLWNTIVRGGFPEAVARTDPDRRAAWFESYVETTIQRDVQDLASIARLADLPRLLRVVATRCSSTLNYASLATDVGMSQSTLRRYLALLESVFLVRLLPAWASNRGKRLIKSPKVYVVDSGLAAWLLGVDAAGVEVDGGLRGSLLESFVAMEFARLATASVTRARLHHFRTLDGREVDVVLEAPDGRVVGIEVKASATVRRADFRGLDALADAAGDRLHLSVVLHAGKDIVPFGPRRWAIPVPWMFD